MHGGNNSILGDQSHIDPNKCGRAACWKSTPTWFCLQRELVLASINYWTLWRSKNRFVDIRGKADNPNKHYIVGHTNAIKILTPWSSMVIMYHRKAIQDWSLVLCNPSQVDWQYPLTMHWNIWFQVVSKRGEHEWVPFWSPPRGLLVLLEVHWEQAMADRFRFFHVHLQLDMLQALDCEAHR